MEKKKYRSAKSGKFVSKEFAKSNKDTTVGETITKPKKNIMSKKVKEVEKPVETACECTSNGGGMWKAIADFIYVGGIIVLTTFAVSFMYVAGKYFALLALGLI